MDPTAGAMWGLGKKAAPVGYWSKGSLAQGNSPREISVSALRSSHAHKDAAPLLFLDVVLYHYIDWIYVFIIYLNTLGIKRTFQEKIKKN